MDARRDAALGAAAFVVGVREVVTRDFPGCVATVGDIATEPGSFNVVPGRARLRLECRSLDAAQLDGLEDALVGRAQRGGGGARARRHRRARRPLWSRPRPTRTCEVRSPTPPRPLGLTTMELPSGAGHDAQSLAADHAERNGVRALQGRRQPRPGEQTAWEDCLNGANVLLRATVALARAARPGDPLAR